MHDFEQNTNSAIGSGIIKTGTILNLDSNNNLLLVVSGTDYGSELDTSKSGLNRNIQTAQVTTKSLTVDPIAIKETFELGRNSTSSQMKSSGKESQERPTIWNDLNKDRNNPSSGSLASSIGSGLLTNAQITLTELAYQVNPLRGFGNIIDGISTDMNNMRSELGISTQTLNIGQDRQFITINKDGAKQEFTLAQYLADPSLAANKLFSNGIMNNEADSIKNAKSQLGTPDTSGRITLLYDPTAFPDDRNAPTSQKVAGFLSDMGEVMVNYAGANLLGGLIQTKGQATDQKFLTAVTDNAKESGTLITLAGHSGGGLRNFLTLQNSSQNQYLDNNGNSVLQVQFSGTPANAFDIYQAGRNSGASVYVNNKSGDTVGNVLGANGNIVEAAWSGVNVVSLFEARLKPKTDVIFSQPTIIFTDIGSAFENLKSDHSTYPCSASWCSSNTSLNTNFNQNSPLAPPKTITNSDSR